MHRLILFLTIAAMPLLSHAIEEPEYEVIKTVDNVNAGTKGASVAE